MTLRPDLSALIGSRICHDLISPIGAIGNGVELLLMDPGNKGAELSMIADSVRNASARIRFFRVAFGAAGQDQRIGRPEVLSVLADLYGSGRLTVTFDGPAEMARTVARRLFLAVLCLESALPFGGRIALAPSAAGWTATGGAPRLRLEPPLWEMLAEGDIARQVTPAQAHFAVLVHDLADAGLRAGIALSETQLRIDLPG